jgi:hypothetical protein
MQRTSDQIGIYIRKSGVWTLLTRGEGDITLEMTTATFTCTLDAEPFE